jgi:hypothetical protein
MREPSQYEAPSCETIGGDFWFPETIPGKKESSVEDTKCAEWGVQNESHGIWGGVTEGERRLIRRKRRITLKGEGIA